MRYLFLLFLASSLLFISCDNRAEETKTWELSIQFPATEVDPGSHTLQAELPKSVKAFLEENKLDPEAITSVELTSVELSIPKLPGNGIEQVSLQFSASGADVQQVGSTGEGFDNSQGSAKLKLAESAKNMAELLAQDKVIAVFDIANEDGSEGEEHSFEAKFSFQVTAKVKS